MSSSPSSGKSSLLQQLGTTRLPTLAEIQAEQLRRERVAASGTLLDFIPWCSPGFSRPLHLKPFVDKLELALKGVPQRVVVHAPPQHAKTDTLLHGFAWGLRMDPRLQLAYATYGDRLTRKKSRRCRFLTARAGVELGESTAVNDWVTTAGGGLIATSVGGPLTGFSKLDVLAIDDPYKDRSEAESAARRQTIEEWWDDVADTRLWPHSSAIVFMTRWHPSDLAGYLIKHHDFEYVKLAALDEDNNALWEQGSWPKARLLAKKQRSPYAFASLFQGDPRARGDTVFDAPSTYSELPVVYRAAFGVDLAYSAKTASDWSVAVKMFKAQGKYYVVHVTRKQERVKRFKKRCRALHRTEPAAPWLWYTSTTEQGVADLFNDGPRGVPLEPRLAKADKLIRAQRYAEAWNAGEVLVPKSAPWLKDFLLEHEDFTGLGDESDDCIDATVAAFDLLDEGLEEIPLEPPRAVPQGLFADGV